MVKDKSKPKRALSPYAVFVQSMRDEHKKKNPSASIDFSAFSKECSAKWKALSAKEKKKYEDIAAKDKERYQKAMKNYTPPSSDDKKKKKKDPNAPKKPMSAFFLFCQDERPKVREAHPDWSVGQCAKELASRWEQCKNRSKYETQASQEKAKYQKAMEKYNAKKGDDSS
ncbi:High mobility group-T protein [Taenia crassiceps]|uniref:High mobility group-T protein n=1 Tax=Taenia crassiceps TaxID=6207 RepID=A0ABR4Q4D9_9CEST